MVTCTWTSGKDYSKYFVSFLRSMFWIVLVQKILGWLSSRGMFALYAQCSFLRLMINTVNIWTPEFM